MLVMIVMGKRKGKELLIKFRYKKIRVADQIIF